MAAKLILLVLLQTLIQYPQMVGDGLDEVTRLRMELREKLLDREMTRLLQELEQSSLEHSVRAWGALLWAALQQGDFWALVIGLLWLWFVFRRRSHEPDNNGWDEGAGDGGGGGNEGEENRDAIVWEVNNGDAIEGEDHNVANEVEEDVITHNLRQRLEEHLDHLMVGRVITTLLMENFTMFIGHLLSDSSYPVPQRAIGVGSAFEGWSPREEDAVYRILVPLNPPRGHTFHLEMDTSGHIPGRNFFIRVEPVCTCPREQQDDNVLCSLHHPEEEQRRNEEPNFLNTLCTGSYLDVEKTARWFYQLVRAAWPALPQSHSWQIVLLPSRRSCKFKLTRGRQSLTVELLFGVQEGNSDIYVSSQPTESLFTPSTVWPETYAVAEMKFFKLIARQDPLNNWHLKCLHVLTRALLGIGFSTYTLKTIVMHLLNTVPMSGWRMRHFRRRLEDTMEYLRGSLEEKRLDHFVVGNRTFPQEILLPPDVKTAEPPNLFHRLAQDPVAHTQAMDECRELGHRLSRMLHDGH
ncbi:inositol 1,4,5-trisphosphate receptor-interacting protein-like 1 [Manacus candei]|nr:inositol 1,4,5-trisphosphate receptor-interacting protein-like 1 isoform X2 [Manacus candei]XP_051625798.1 inositol 1,4,5-trisphosphate receptor-interacting protein-like 1 [Manacus candei]XP_051625799.1 inositol 1,4,5-trisphosphate receptor-interacting protein-like 1 [Manacus candei]